MTEADLPSLWALLPDDLEMNPHATTYAGLDDPREPSGGPRAGVLARPRHVVARRLGAALRRAFGRRGRGRPVARGAGLARRPHRRLLVVARRLGTGEGARQADAGRRAGARLRPAAGRRRDQLGRRRQRGVARRLAGPRLPRHAPLGARALGGDAAARASRARRVGGLGPGRTTSSSPASRRPFPSSASRGTDEHSCTCSAALDGAHALLLDVDDTIVDTQEAMVVAGTEAAAAIWPHRAAEHRAMAQRYYDDPERWFPRYASGDVAFDADACRTAGRGRHGLRSRDPERGPPRLRGGVCAGLPRCPAALPRRARLLAAAEGEGLPVALLTNSAHAPTRVKLEALDLAERFDGRRDDRHARVRQARPRVYLEACRLLAAEPAPGGLHRRQRRVGRPRCAGGRTACRVARPCGTADDPAGHVRAWTGRGRRGARPPIWATAHGPVVFPFGSPRTGREAGSE